MDFAADRLIRLAYVQLKNLHHERDPGARVRSVFFGNCAWFFGVKLMEINSNGCFPCYFSSPNNAKVKRTQGFGENYMHTR